MRQLEKPQKPLKTRCTCISNEAAIYFLLQNRLALLVREHLCSMSVVIVTINRGMDDDNSMRQSSNQNVNNQIDYIRYFKIWRQHSLHMWFSNLNTRGNSFCIYRYTCFDFFKKSLATTDSLFISTSFSSCIILRSILAFRYQTKIALVYSLSFFGTPLQDCVNNHK